MHCKGAVSQPIACEVTLAFTVVRSLALSLALGIHVVVLQIEGVDLSVLYSALSPQVRGVCTQPVGPMPTCSNHLLMPPVCCFHRSASWMQTSSGTRRSCWTSSKCVFCPCTRPVVMSWRCVLGWTMGWQRLYSGRGYVDGVVRRVKFSRRRIVRRSSRAGTIAVLRRRRGL